MTRHRSDRLKRRALLQGMGGALGAAALGCGSGAEQTVAQGPAPTGGAGGAGGHEGVGGAGGSGSGGSGGAGGSGPADICGETTGLSAKELLDPIKTIVVLCMENRSFDHYLGSLRLVEGKDVIGLKGDEWNPDPNGIAVPVFNLQTFTPADLPHGWDPSHQQWNQGKNDGFVIAHEGEYQNDAMGYHVRDQIPITYALSDASAICHRYFASVMGPTWPNRFYLHCGSSKGQKSNVPVFGLKSIWSLLNDAGVSNVNYFHDVPWAAGGIFKTSGNQGIEKFFEAAAQGALPQFSIIDPQFFGAGANDDHPDHDVQLGQALISSVFTALANSPQWKNCLFVLTYDEHGGFFDHVPPPVTVDDDAGFEQMGFRVPTLVAGPFVRGGCVANAVFDHTSILKTVALKFGLPFLTKRVEAANDFSGLISPTYLTNPQPAPELPKLSMSMAALRARPASTADHREMWEAAERGIIPPHLDRRSRGLGATEHVLKWGERMGALKIRR